jgi:hypothetical protein
MDGGDSETDCRSMLETVMVVDRLDGHQMSVEMKSFSPPVSVVGQRPVHSAKKRLLLLSFDTFLGCFGHTGRA